MHKLFVKAFWEQTFVKYFQRIEREIQGTIVAVPKVDI